MLVQYGSSSELSFLLKTALERRVRLQKPERKGGIETGKSLHSLECLIDTNSSDWNMKHYNFSKWLSSETENNNCWLVASIETQSIQQDKAAFLPSWWLICGKLRHERGFATSTHASRKNLSQAAGLTLSNKTLNISIPLATPPPSRSGNYSR